MSSNDESAMQEIVIIRRRSGEEDGGHHGGVWKIAYADFMTAMMAFFLVMWLINATDKKVITQVATYFNPLRLTDKAPTPKGMHDANTGAPGKENSKGESKQKEGQARASKIGPATQKNPEEALFKDPYDALDKLAEQSAATGPKEQQPTGGGAIRQSQGTVAGGEAFRDPFEPEFRRSPTKQIVQDTTPPTTEKKTVPVHEGHGKEAQRDAAGATAGAMKERRPEATQAEMVAAKDASAAQQAEPKPAPELAAMAKDGAQLERTAKEGPASAPKDNGAQAEKAAKEAADAAERARLDRDIRDAVAQLGAVPDIDVKVTEEGLLISLTDKFDFGMFAIASAEPRPAMVAVMDRIAKVLQSRPGALIIRGHTDGRPFRSANYDNWRLSSARAQMAYYMLVRGGIDEKRVERIEGHADRSLRVPGDPDAAQNRRIELLLRMPKS